MDKTLLDHDAETEWPAYLPVACAVIVTAILGVTVSQDRHADYAFSAGLVAAAAILLPFLIDSVLAFASGIRYVGVPLWLLPITTAAGVSYFMWHPAEVDVAPFLLVFVNGEVVSRSRGRTPVAIMSGVLSIGAVIAAQVFGPWVEGAVIWVAGIAFGWLGGWLVRELTAKTTELQAAQAGLEAQAAERERSRIAREVHDVIAHSLSVTMLHVTAARMALEQGKAAGAVDALREAEQQGRRSLAEVRRTVGLLGPETAGATAPMPQANDVPRLVDDFRNAGLDVTLHVEGSPEAIGETAGLGVYRIVQESLTNVAKHAPGAAVTVDLDLTNAIRLRVHNPVTNGHARDDGTGLGVRGMTERAALLGGTLRAGQDGGMWTVALDAPRPSADAR